MVKSYKLDPKQSEEEKEKDEEEEEEEGVKKFLPQSLADQFRWFFKEEDKANKEYLEVFQIQKIVLSLLGHLFT